MKTHIAALLVLSCLTFSSCKKDAQDLIVGNWELDDMYDSDGKKLTTNGKFYDPFGNSYDYFLATVQFHECASGTDSCVVDFTSTFHFKDPNTPPNPITKTYSYSLLDNSTLLLGSTKYKIAKLTKKKLEIYPVDYDKSIRTYNRK